MGRRKKEDLEESGERLIDGIKSETKRAVSAILLLLIAIIISLSAFGLGGSAGNLMYKILGFAFGQKIGYWVIVLVLILASASLLKNIEHKFSSIKIFASVLIFFSALGLIDLIEPGMGGFLGKYIKLPLFKLFAFYSTFIIFSAVILISIMIIFEAHFNLKSFAFWRLFKKENEDGTKEKNLIKIKNSSDDITDEEQKLSKLAELEKKENEERIQKKKGMFGTIKSSLDDEDFDDSTGIIKNNLLKGKEYNPPPISLLEKDRGKAEVGDVKANANIIKRTFTNFGINVEMDEISIGPTVTRYALKPAEGVKLSRIVSLNSDLALALAAHPIRIEAPIPGKSLVGIEVPNNTKSIVGLASLLGSSEFKNSEKPLLMALGKDISGKCHYTNLAKAPHMLVAGATGSGKSVTIHAMITSLLYKNSPEMLRFIFIDPKRVELTLYNKIPHLLTPVITDAKKAIKMLRWAGNEMHRRYNILEKNTCRDIESYHKNILAPALEKRKRMNVEENENNNADTNGEGNIDADFPETMPYIVIIIDELADIMHSYPRELESAIVKLAQMSRATGIHLILSTQRPSVNVITGLIKANIPTRVALQVASQIDSRTILDQAGAEKLLGAGDMLYLAGDMPNPVRLQSAFVSEGEAKKVVKHIYEEFQDEIFERFNIDENNNKETEAGSGAVFNASNFDDEEDLEEDEYYDEAKKVILESGKASTSFLQRRLKLGYSRAARIMDMMEKRGVIGPAIGAKPREILDPSYQSQKSSSPESIMQDENVEKWKEVP